MIRSNEGFCSRNQSSPELLNIVDKLIEIKDLKVVGSRFGSDRFGFDGYSE